MNDYINTVLIKYNHLQPKTCRLSPYIATPIIYGTQAQYTQDINTSPPLDASNIKRIQGILVASLYYARAVDKKLLHTLSKISSEQATATNSTNKKIEHLLDYCATYPSDGITYRAINMILTTHSGAAYLNISHSCSHTGTHVMCAENDPIPSHNRPVLTISQIIIFVTSSAAKSELASLFICAK